MIRPATRTVTVLIALVALAVGALVGALAFAKDSSSDGQPSGDAVIEPVIFQADAGVSERPILRLGGLTLKASCRDFGPGTGTHLAVGAETAVDDAIAAASFGQKAGSTSDEHTFVQSDFDRSYGLWDFLGTNPDNTAGTFHFSRPDGGQVSVSFVADGDTAQGECVFGGVATYAP